MFVGDVSRPRMKSRARYLNEENLLTCNNQQAVKSLITLPVLTYQVRLYVNRLKLRVQCKEPVLDCDNKRITIGLCSKLASLLSVPKLHIPAS
jgi:hypothetical protein